MSLDTLPDLRCLMMVDGTLFGHVEDASTLCPMEIRQGSALAPFETCDQAPITLFNPARRHDFDASDLPRKTSSRPAEETPGDVYACWVNHLPDWALQGSDTVQLMINRHDRPCEVFLNAPINIPDVQEGMVFEALLAVHRANAQLCLRLVDPISGKEETLRFPFDGAHSGGAHPSGYAQVRQPLPDRFSACRIELSIEYLGHSGQDKQTEPFLFLADICVRQDATEHDQLSILRPEWLLGDTPQQQGQWIKAPLPAALVPGQGISVTLGGQTYPFTPMSKPDFTVRENYGHTLVCASAQGMDLLLCIDGQHVAPVRINRNDTIIRIPNRFLTGHVRHLSLKDRSGCVTLFEQQQLMPAIVTPGDVMQRESTAPFPATLFAQTPLRYAGLKAILENAGPETDLAQLAHALHTVEGGHENIKLLPLCFPTVEKPDVSVIIPAHNGIELTYLALCSLLLAQNDASFEVIVVDDGSTDETRALETLVQGINVVRNRTPSGSSAPAMRARNRHAAPTWRS
ncbi:MAG: glycosyltransferase family 2 protein [Sulfitobacter sp.]|nr:glycosyltransferase family 2 protein [Sulfitobacter sp.]